jgi:hypothetical protein
MRKSAEAVMKDATEHSVAKKSGDWAKSGEKTKSSSGGSTYDFMLAYGPAGEAPFGRFGAD